MIAFVIDLSEIFLKIVLFECLTSGPGSKGSWNRTRTRSNISGSETLIAAGLLVFSLIPIKLLQIYKPLEAFLTNKNEDEKTYIKTMIIFCMAGL